MSIFAHRTTRLYAIAITAFVATLALAFVIIAPNATQAADLTQVLDSKVLRDCDVKITKYQDSHQVRMDVNEGSGLLYYFITIDGISNENRNWGAFRTDDGVAFYMRYNHTNAGEEHQYFVRISPIRGWIVPTICESSGSFYVKGDPVQDPTQLPGDSSGPDTPVQGGADGPDSDTPTPTPAGGDATEVPPSQEGDNPENTTPTPEPTPDDPTLTPEPPGDELVILRECNITITKYVDSFRVRMDIAERPGGRMYRPTIDGVTNENTGSGAFRIDERPAGRMYWPTIDGVTNENRGWAAFRTDDGIAFIMRYNPTNAGEIHEYLVRVSPWYAPPFCESRGTFHVKT